MVDGQGAHHQLLVRFRVKPAAGGEGPLSGTLRVTDNRKLVHVVTIKSNGAAKLRVKLHKGKNRIVAKYGGNAFYRKSTGHALVHGRRAHH